MPCSRLIQGGDHLAVGAYAFGDIEGIAARHHRLGLAVVNVVDGAPALPLQREQVAESLRREERHLRAFALEHRVGGDGRAVHEIGGGIQRQTRLVERGNRAQVRRRRRARHLGDAHAACLEGHEIGERAADLDSHPSRFAHGCRRALSPIWTGDGIISALLLGGCGRYTGAPCAARTRGARGAGSDRDSALLFDCKGAVAAQSIHLKKFESGVSET